MSTDSAERSAGGAANHTAEIAPARKRRDTIANGRQLPHPCSLRLGPENNIPEPRSHPENRIGLFKVMRQMPRSQPLLNPARRPRKMNPIVNEFVTRKPRRDPAKKNHPRR